MKSFKQFTAETVDKPRSPDEQAFIDKHVVDKKKHPVAGDDQFVAKTKKDNSKAASYKEGEDKEVYEETESSEEDEESDPSGLDEMSDAQMKKREEIVKSMKSKMGDFKKRYGDKAKDVMYATATKMAMQNEEIVAEGVMDDLRNIVKSKSAKQVKFDDGSRTKVDMFTASAMVKVYDALKPANQEKFAATVGKSQQSFMKMMDFAFGAAK